jgi:hypothetical protein
MEWLRQSSPRKKISSYRRLLGKSWLGILLVEFLNRGATVNSERYAQTLSKLKQRIRRFEPNRKMNQVLFVRDNAKPHTDLCTTGAIATMVCTVLPHPPYYSLFFHFVASEGCMPRTPFCGRRLVDTACLMSSDASAKSFTLPAHSVSCKGGKIV